MTELNPKLRGLVLSRLSHPKTFRTRLERTKTIFRRMLKEKPKD